MHSWVSVLIQVFPPQIYCPVTFRLIVVFFPLADEMIVGGCWQKRMVLNGGYCSVSIRPSG